MGQYTCVDDTLKCFEWLENYRKLSDTTTINLVKMYLRFLKMFLVSEEKLSTKEDTYHISDVQDWAQNAGKTIQSLCANAVKESDVTEEWHDKIKDLNSKIGTSYSSVLQLDATVSNICLVELIDSVSNNLNDVLGHKTKSIHGYSIKKQIDILQVKFRFLRNFAWFNSQRCIEHHKLEDVLRMIEVMATTTACLLFQCLFEDADTTLMETKFSQVLLTIQLIEPELRNAYFRSLKFSLPSLLESNSSMEIEDAIRFLCCFLNDLNEILSHRAYLMASARDHVCNLCEELNFLIALLMDSPKINAEDLLARTKTVVTKTAHVVLLLLGSSNNEDDASGDDPNYLLFDLLDEIDIIKKKIVTENYLQHRKSMRSNLIPKVNSLGLIDFLLGIVNVVLNNKADSADFARHQLEFVKAELVSLRSLLCVNDLETKVTDVVHEAKHAIGALIIRESPRWHCLLQLSNVIIKIQDINNKVAAKFVKNRIVEIGGDTGAQNSDSMPSVKSEMEV